MTEALTATKGRTATVRCRDGKYLTFALAQEQYGLESPKVREMAKVGESVKILLDIDKVFCGNSPGGLAGEGDDPK